MIKELLEVLDDIASDKLAVIVMVLLTGGTLQFVGKLEGEMANILSMIIGMLSKEVVDNVRKPKA